MTVANTKEACEKLDRLLDEAAAVHEPVLITGPRPTAPFSYCTCTLICSLPFAVTSTRSPCFR